MAKKGYPTRDPRPGYGWAPCAMCNQEGEILSRWSASDDSGKDRCPRCFRLGWVQQSLDVLRRSHPPTCSCAACVGKRMDAAAKAEAQHSDNSDSAECESSEETEIEEGLREDVETAGQAEREPDHLATVEYVGVDEFPSALREKDPYKEAGEDKEEKASPKEGEVSPTTELETEERDSVEREESLMEEGETREEEEVLEAEADRVEPVSGGVEEPAAEESVSDRTGESRDVGSGSAGRSSLRPAPRKGVPTRFGEASSPPQSHQPRYSPPSNEDPEKPWAWIIGIGGILLILVAGVLLIVGRGDDASTLSAHKDSMPRPTRSIPLATPTSTPTATTESGKTRSFPSSTPTAKVTPGPTATPRPTNRRTATPTATRVVATRTPTPAPTIPLTAMPSSTMIATPIPTPVPTPTPVLSPRLEPRSVTTPTPLPLASPVPTSTPTPLEMPSGRVPGGTLLDAANIYTAVIRYTNEARVASGLSPLLEDMAISKIAFIHSANMAISGVLSHTLKRQGPTDRALASGYDCRAYRGDGSYTYGLSENIFQSPRVRLWTSWTLAGVVTRTEPTQFIETSEEMGRALVTGWLNSAGHRANILDPYAARIGVGIYIQHSIEHGYISETVWATQNFSECT